jgi:hypothetical protein
MNPYETPNYSDPAKYDYGLVKRVLLALSVIAIVYCAIWFCSAWSDFNKAECITSMPIMDKIRAFFTDWNYRPPMGA